MVQKGLLKKMISVLCAAAVAFCVQMPAKAAGVTQSDLVGKWYGSWATVEFTETGMATDKWNTRAYHIEGGSITLQDDEVIQYDVWRGEKIQNITQDDKYLGYGIDAVVYQVIEPGKEMIAYNVGQKYDGDTSKWELYGRTTIVKGAASPSESTVADTKKEEQVEMTPEELIREQQEAERRAVEEANLALSKIQSKELAVEASEKGFADMNDLLKAKARNKSADEYYNNAVVNTPGIENAVTVAQGGGLIVDGKETNMTAVIDKVDKAYVDSVRKAVEGTVLNVVKVTFPAKEATVNFYMPGVKADDKITAVQWVDGEWIEIAIAEVRADHVILNMTQNGVVAFIRK